MGNNEIAADGDPDSNFAPPSPPSNTDYRHARWPRLSSPTRAEAKPESEQPEQAHGPKVLIVGVCSAGKSTLARKLKELGLEARTCAQEHSYVPHMWQLSNPDLLIYLDASLHTVRRRRGTRWKQAILDEEHRRLSHARQHCDLYIHTDGLAPEDVASKALTFLNNRVNRSKTN